jgi:outer membrane protein assembly factor BamD (BamD/ComL family)
MPVITRRARRRRQRRTTLASFSGLAMIARSLSVLCFLTPGLLTGCMEDKQNLVNRGKPAETAKAEDTDKDNQDDEDSWFKKYFGEPRMPWEWFQAQPVPPPPPADSLILQGDNLVPAKPVKLGTAEAKLEGAKELYRRGDYEGASQICKHLADNTKNSVQVAEEARYYEAECYRREARYPKAGDTYIKMLTDFPSGACREQGAQHLFDIANFWLEDTREEMRENREKKEGKRWVVWPHFVNFDKSKPLLDEEGRAIETLEQVRYNDMVGPLADKALFLIGSVKFFNQDYKDADHYFSQLVEMHPNSPFAAEAVELGIISKHLSTGGADYDGRKVAEARILVHKALNNYKELAEKKNDFLTRQLVGITYQQAEKDYKVAEFYRRQGHPGSAYFYYEIVRRRYPGTRFADLATERMHELHDKLQKKGEKVPAPPPMTGPGPGGPADREVMPSPRPAQDEMAPMPRRVPAPAETAPSPRPYTGPQ